LNFNHERVSHVSAIDADSGTLELRVPPFKRIDSTRYRLLRVYGTITYIHIDHLLLGFNIPPRSNSFVDG